MHGSDAIELAAGVWQKRVLPIGQVEYKGRVLNFDKRYLDGLAQSYNAGAYSQVPFQLADAGNNHTNDPERFRGEVTGMSVGDDGLYITVQTTDAGNQVLRANPRLGVSARIVEDYARSDGQYYPVAIQHVLGTLDPRIPELGPWQEVEMSNVTGADSVIDLSQSAWLDEPGYGELDFAAGGGQGHPLSSGLRGLADDLDTRHPDMGAGDHVRDAANMMDIGMHDAAKRHLRAAMANMTPQSLTRHGKILDDQHNLAKRSMDDIHRHLLLVQQDQDEGDGGQETDHHPDVKARTDVAQPVPGGSQAMGTYSNDGGNSYEFADPMAGAYQALELAHQQAAQRQAEDAARRAAAGPAAHRHVGLRGQAGRGTGADLARHVHRDRPAAGDGVRERHGGGHGGPGDRPVGRLGLHRVHLHPGRHPRHDEVPHPGLPGGRDHAGRDGRGPRRRSAAGRGARRRRQRQRVL